MANEPVELAGPAAVGLAPEGGLARRPERIVTWRTRVSLEQTFRPNRGKSNATDFTSDPATAGPGCGSARVCRLLAGHGTVGGSPRANVSALAVEVPSGVGPPVRGSQG